MAKKRQYVKKFIKKQKQNAGEIELPENPTNGDLIGIFNWYNQADFTDKVKKGWVLEYAAANMSKKDTARLKKVNEKFFTGTISTVCRVANRGMVTESGTKFIAKNMPALVARAPEPVKEEKVTVNKPTIQDRIKEQAKVLMADVDYFVDCKLQDDVENKLELNDTGAPQAKHVLAHIESYLKEFYEVKEARLGDKELFKAYGMTPKAVNAMLRYLESLKADVEKYLNVKKKTRKVSTRAKKVKSPTELAKNCTVAENSPLKPAKVVGSSMAVTYKEKYGEIYILFAEDAGGLSLRGTSIVNVCPNKSHVLKVKKAFAKKWQKELESKNGVNALKRLIKEEDKFKVTKKKANGRLSDQVQILKAI